VVIGILVVLEAGIFWAVNSLGITGLVGFIFKAALPAIVIIGFLVIRLIGNK
jgi:hypothetical protein